MWKHCNLETLTTVISKSVVSDYNINHNIQREGFPTLILKEKIDTPNWEGKQSSFPQILVLAEFFLDLGHSHIIVFIISSG
jgi:hypothetical protein